MPLSRQFGLLLALAPFRLRVRGRARGRALRPEQRDRRAGDQQQHNRALQRREGPLPAGQRPRITNGHNDCYGQDAYQYNRDLVLGQGITLTYDEQMHQQVRPPAGLRRDPRRRNQHPAPRPRLRLLPLHPARSGRTAPPSSRASSSARARPSAACGACARTSPVTEHRGRAQVGGPVCCGPHVCKQAFARWSASPALGTLTPVRMDRAAAPVRLPLLPAALGLLLTCCVTASVATTPAAAAAAPATTASARKQLSSGPGWVRPQTARNGPVALAQVAERVARPAPPAAPGRRLRPRPHPLRQAARAPW